MPLTITLEPTTVAPGDAMTLAVQTDPGERDRFVETPFVVQVTVPGVGAGPANGTLREPTDDAPVLVSDPDREWTLLSDDGDVAVFEATA